MGVTNFPNGATSWGLPAGLSGDFGLMRMTAKNASMFFLDPRDGASHKRRKTSLTDLNSSMTDEYGDCAIFLGHDGGTGSSSRDTANVAWSNSGCTVIGACAPIAVSHRARVAPSTTFAEPLLTVSGNNNVFANMQFFQGHNAASTCVSVTGDRNFFAGCHFGGIGHATAGDDAGSESVLIDGGSENVFYKCVFGLDTIARSVATAELRFDNAATRNMLVDCIFLCFDDAGDALFVDIPGAGDIDRWAWFENCKFFNAIDSTATAMSNAMNIHASAGGTVVLNNCLRYGATDWAASFVNLAQLSLNSGTAATDMGAAINGS